MSKLISFIVVTLVLLSVCDASTTINTYAGDNAQAAAYNGDSGAATAAGIGAYGIAFDSSDNLYIASFVDTTVRKVTTAGIISTFAGSTNSPGHSGDGGDATSALLKLPYFVYVDPSDSYLYISDIGSSENHVRRVNLATNKISLYAGDMSGTIADDIQATSANICYPQGMKIRGSTFYLVDQCNHAIRMIASSGVIKTYAGTLGTSGYSGDGAAAASAKLNNPNDLVFDSSGNMYISEQGSALSGYSIIRKVDATTKFI